MFTKLLSLLTGRRRTAAALDSRWATQGPEIGLEIGAAGPLPLRLTLVASLLDAYTLALEVLDELEAVHGKQAELIVRIGTVQRLGKHATPVITELVLEAGGPAATLRTRIRSLRTRLFRRTVRATATRKTR